MLHRFLAPTLLAVLAAAALAAETEITITVPKLKPGMARLETMLASQTDDFSAEIGEIIADSLDKPLFMAGFCGAAANTVLVPASIPENGRPSFYLGSAASVCADEIFGELASKAGSLDAESDEKLGASIQPLTVRAAIPLDGFFPGRSGDGHFIRGCYAAANLGFMDAETGDYGVWAFSAGLDGGISLGNRGRGLAAWDGVSVRAGVDYARNRLTALVSPGVISQEIPVDPDGEGPLVPSSATLEIDPDIRAGVDSSIVSVSLGASTGVCFFEAFTLFAGGGISASWAQAGISIDADEEIVINGYLSNLVDKPGRISITGSTATETAMAFGGFLEGGVKFTIGSFSFTMPIVWKPLESLGFGVFMGVSL